MIWKSPSGAGVIANHKVFSTEIARRIGDKKLLENLPPHFRGRIHNTIPIFKTRGPLHLLVADPVVKFYAACREDHIKPWVALVKVQEGWLGTHLEHQSRFLQLPNQIYLYRAPDHVAEFWEALGLGDPPKVYTKPNPTDLDEEIRQVYSSDQILFESIKVSGQLANRSIVPPVVTQLKSAARAVGKFIASGKFVTQKQFDDRMKICKACEFWDQEEFMGTGRCRKCGCSTWAKLRMATESCPLGKWQEASKPLQK